MRKFSRLQTWERAVLRAAAAGIIFSASSAYLLLRNVYPEIVLTDVQRAIAALSDLGYLEISSESDPSYRNRPSYVCSASGYDFQQLIDEREALLSSLILQNL